MRLLLDTHAFLWFTMGDSNLSDTARIQIENADNQKFVILVSVWEMAIKSSTGKMKFHQTLPELLTVQMERNGFDYLPIDLAHIIAVEKMSFIHNDPFDRLLFAQSIAEDLTLVSIGAVADAHGVNRCW
jgi:PIN domain nuclease of toxin-antitoxin system